MKVLIFGATGSAGGSVVRSCLNASIVSDVRTITRRPLPLDHPKLRAIVHDDFLNFSPVADAFEGIGAIFFCLGVSITQVKNDDEYRRITHDYALAAAAMMKARSPDSGFQFISGQGTNPGSRVMWSRVKGETENELMALVGANCFRPAAIDGEPSENAPRAYKMLRPFYRLLRPFRSLYIGGEALGHAMLQATGENLRRRVFENRGIRELAERARV